MITRAMLASQRAFCHTLREQLNYQRKTAESQRTKMERQQERHRGGTLDLGVLNALVAADTKRETLADECELNAGVRANLDVMIGALIDVRTFLAAMQARPATRGTVGTLLASLRGYRRRI